MTLAAEGSETRLKAEEDQKCKEVKSKDEWPLWNADPNCEHEIITLWSGIKCSKCSGWCCL